MTTEPPPGEPSRPLTPAVAISRRPGWQFGLRTALLIVAVAAVATAIVKDRRQIDWLAQKIIQIQSLARDLVIDDPARIAVVKLPELWMDDNRWDVYLPAGSSYQLSIATRDIDLKASSPPLKTATLPPGRHRIALEEQQDDARNWHLTITRDEARVIEVDEPATWTDGSGSVGGGDISISQQYPADQPVTLFRRQFTIKDEHGRSDVSGGRLPGILLWIEPATSTNSSAR